MMQKLRKKTRLVLFIALAGFAGLIFFQWGLDITGIKNPQKTNIAKIDGIPILYTDYLRFVQAKMREKRGITNEEIWAEMIDQIMWNNLMRKEKIRVTNDEIWVIIKNNPPREIYESEYMMDEKGEFDINKYYEFLTSPQSRQWLLQYEYTLREQLPKEKLRSLIATMSWVSPHEDSLLIAWKTTRYDISYINVPLYKIRTLVQISEEEIREYYNRNLEEFINPESKILKYVLFEKTPSYEDTLEAKERMEDFIIRIKEEGENFLEVAKEVSDDPTIENDFQDEIELPPYLKNIYKKLKNREISDIIEAPHGFEVIKRIRKGLIYQVKANIQISPTTIGEIHDRIVSFKETILECSFDSATVDFNLLMRKTYPLTKDNMSFPVRNPDALTRFLTNAKIGDIAGPLNSLGGYYVFMIDSIIPEFEPRFEEIVSRIKAKFEKEKIKEEMNLYLDKINSQLKVGKTMEAIASLDSSIIFQNYLRNVTLTQFKNGYGEKFAGVVAALEPGQISSPLPTDWAGYIIRCDKKAVIPFDSTMITSLQMKRQIRLQQLTQSLFTPKEIEDSRDEFFE